jgi:low temperature requirement protein LtrA
VTLRNLVKLAPFNLLAAFMVLAGGIAGGAAQYILWALAGLFEWSTPRIITTAGFLIRTSHFVERHGLVVIVAIGESIVAIGIASAGLAIDLPLVVFAILGLAFSACLWWAYFGDEEGTERALAAAPPERQSRIAVDAFGAWHIPILLGIVAIAATEKQATGHVFDPLDFEPALGLAVGLSVFLIGDAMFRRTLGIGRGGAILAAAVLAPATIPLGTELSAFAELAALVALLIVTLGGEARAAAKEPRAASGSP